VEDFHIIRPLGKGSSAEVYQAEQLATGRMYAMKRLKKKMIVDHEKTEHTMSERSVLPQMRHPFIVTLHHSFQSRDMLYYILDYCPGGELFYHLKVERTFTTSRAMLYTAEIALGLDHMHSLGIIYRDLKPENILIDAEGHIKLADFDLCKRTRDDASSPRSQRGSVGPAKTFCGTPEYTAPEMILGQAKMTYGKSVDWWALGTVLYEMLSGLPPFYNQVMAKMYQKILYDELQYKPPMDPLAFALVQRLLIRDPVKRLGSSPHDMGKLKRDPFFAELQWQDVLERKTTPAFRPGLGVNYVDPETVPSSNMSGSYSRYGSQSGSTDSQIFHGFTYNKASLSSTPLGYSQRPTLHEAVKDSSYSSQSSDREDSSPTVM